MTKCLIKCPVCDFEARVRLQTPRFFCKCGSSFTLESGVVGELMSEGHILPQSKQEPRAVPEIYWKRLEDCKPCVHYMGNERCKLIDLGCRNKFRMRLDDEDASCPAGKWKRLETRGLTDDMV